MRKPRKIKVSSRIGLKPRHNKPRTIKGKKIVDANEPLQLSISKADVRAGKVRNPSGCAAAVALERECKGAVSAHVHLSRVYVEYPDKIVRYKTPPALRTEIVSFDRGHRFDAGDYMLPPPPPSDVRRIGRQQGSSTSQTNPNRDRRYRKRPYHQVSGVRVRAPHNADWK